MVGIELWGLSRLMVVHGLGETSHPPGLLHDRVHMGSCWPFPAVLPAQTHSALFSLHCFCKNLWLFFSFSPPWTALSWGDITSAMPTAISSTLCTKLNKYLSNCVYKEKNVVKLFNKTPGTLFLFACVHKIPSDWVWEKTYWKFWTLLGIRGLLQLHPPKQTEKHHKEKWKISIWYPCVLEQVTISYIRIKFSPLNVRVRRKNY